MPRYSGLTRRQLLETSAAAAAAVGVGACGDDYFEPATSHGRDAPNALLIFTDSTRADYIRHYNPDSLAKTPNIDALARQSLSFSLAVPEAMPTGPARRALLSGVRSFPFRNYVPTKGLPLGPGWTPIPDQYPIVTEVMGDAGIETGYCTDNPFLIGPRRHAARSSAICCRSCPTVSRWAGCGRWWVGTRSTAIASGTIRPRAWCGLGSGL